MTRAASPFTISWSPSTGLRAGPAAMISLDDLVNDETAGR